MLNPTKKMNLTAENIMIIDPQINNYQSLIDVAIANTPTKGTEMASILVVFDRRVQELELLYNALLPGAVGYTIDAQEDALTVITQLLTETGAARLAIVAHGEPGVVEIGVQPLNWEQLREKSHLLQEWGVENIALYSCEVGKDRQFIAELERLTGATVVATTGKVGSTEQGGSWELDAKSVNWAVNSPLAIDQLANYTGVLATTTATNVTDTFDGGVDNVNDTIKVTNPNQLNSGDDFNGGGGNDTIAIDDNAGTFDFIPVTISN
ncbi:MAG TPA: hypothetical protein DCQ51_10155, partial [Planktothrix sp. UBA8407]|nr:hypothetical protein [Planktothrix sp. UBA8407]